MTTFFDRLTNETKVEREALYAVPQIIDGMKGEITREAYIAYLTEAYHHVKHTTPLLMLAGSRFGDDKEWAREAFAKYIDEEIGHQEWILNDIKNAGGNADLVRNGKPSFATEIMVSYDLVSRKNPIAFLGSVFVLEGTSTTLATYAAETIMNSLSLRKDCFSYLLSHGSLDISHMKFFTETVNRINNKEDQEAIIHSAKNFYQLFANIFRGIANHK